MKAVRPFMCDHCGTEMPLEGQDRRCFNAIDAEGFERRYGMKPRSSVPFRVIEGVSYCGGTMHPLEDYAGAVRMMTSRPRPPKHSVGPSGRPRVRIDLCEPCRVALQTLFDRLGRPANGVEALAVMCPRCAGQLHSARGAS